MLRVICSLSLFFTEKKRNFSFTHMAPLKPSTNGKPVINQRKLLPQNGQQPGLGVLCALRKHPLCPQPSHAAFKLRKITCSSKLGRTGRKHGAHRSPGADQDRFPVNPQGYNEISSPRSSAAFFPPRTGKGGPTPHQRGGVSGNVGGAGAAQH